MQIKPVSRKLYNNYSCLKQQKLAYQNEKIKNSGEKVPLYVLQSNFMPSFGRFRKVKTVELINRDTLMPQRAELMRDRIGDFLFYKLMVNRKEAGYMNMNCDSVFPEDDYVLTEPDNNIPKILEIRSLMGETYSGIGTELIKEAVTVSRKRGKGGALWLHSSVGYGRDESRYRKNENPIPFYYKMGFRSPDKVLHKQIKELIKSGNIKMLPSLAVMLLTSEAAEKHFKTED